MKKKTKWILIICAILLVLLTAAVILTLVLKEKYLKKLPYDGLHSSIYNNVQIVNDNGQFYLISNGERSKNGYTYLKSINDFYTESASKALASRQLYSYYLAKKSEDSNYWLVEPDGSEYRIAGENFSLSEVALPYLIFTHNTNSRKAAISLRGLQSDLSSHSGSTLALTQTFPDLTLFKTDDQKETYDFLIAQTSSEENKQIIFSASGKKLLSGEDLSPICFEKESGDTACYFLDHASHTLYSSKGELLSVGESDPVFSPDEAWGYQYSALSSSTGSSSDQSVCFFSAERSFSITNWDYDLSTLRVVGTCILVNRLHEDAVSVICPETGDIRSYTSILEKNGFLLATSNMTGDLIYISPNGEELMRSTYDDMKLHAVTTENCFVFTSPLYNTQAPDTLSYFFTMGGKSAVELQLPLESSLTIPDQLCGLDVTTPMYLIVKNDRDGTALYQIYTPFSVNTESNFYHAIDFYCHGGILWAMGTSYTKECYDILDPVNNVLTISVAAKTTDLARLSFEHCQSDVLLSNTYNGQSDIPIEIIKLNRYEEKQSGIAATRYFAIYRTAFSTSKSFQNASLQVKELGQNLLLDHPYRFFSDQNVLAIYSALGTRIYRFDDTNHLTESASTPYHVTDVLSDGENAAQCYLKIVALSDHGVHQHDNAPVGIANGEGILLLPPSYDEILFAEGNRFVVSLRQALGVVEAHGEKPVTLIDFEHTELLPLPDGAYLGKTQNGSYTLYEGGKRVQRNILSVSWIEIANMDEDGYPVYAKAPLLNIKGTLYFHMPKVFESPRFDSVEAPVSHSSELVDRRAKLVSYYDESGVLTASDLLLPTKADEKNFIDNHIGEWYASPKTEEQIEPLSAEAILSSSDFFFRLYPKVVVEEIE